MKSSRTTVIRDQPTWTDEQTDGRRPMCIQCSGLLGHDVHHRHFSGIRHRTQGGGDVFPCEPCFGHHFRSLRGRLAIHVSSSMLFCYWRVGQSVPLESRHIDHLAISGATVSTLRLVCEADLRNVNGQPVDVVLTGGAFNSIARGKTAYKICDEYLEFEKMVKAHNPSNTFVVATVPFAPKFCPSLCPSLKEQDQNGCNNKMDTIWAVNEFILNKWPGSPKLHTIGLCKNPESGQFGLPDHLFKKLNSINPSH